MEKRQKGDRGVKGNTIINIERIDNYGNSN